VIRVRGEVPEDGPIPSLFPLGPDLLDPRDASGWKDRVAVGVENRSGEVGERGGIADCHINVSPVGGGDETAVGPGRSRVPGEGATGAKSETDCRGPIWRVELWPRASSQRSVTLVLSAGGSSRGSLGRTDRMEVWVEETALRRSMVVAVDVEKLAAGAVKAVEGRLVDIDGRAARTQEGSRCANVGRREGGVKGAYEGTWCIRGGSGMSTGRRKPRPAR
jgi:hypothetical protein